MVGLCLDVLTDCNAQVSGKIAKRYRAVGQPKSHSAGTTVRVFVLCVHASLLLLSDSLLLLSDSLPPTNSGQGKRFTAFNTPRHSQCLNALIWEKHRSSSETRRACPLILCVGVGV